MKFIFLPDTSSRVVEFKLSKFQLCVLFPLALSLAIGCIVYSMTFLADGVYTFRLRQLEENRNVLSAQLTDLKEKSASLNSRIQGLFEMDDDLRTFADIPPMPENYREVGVGGTVPQPIPTLPLFEKQADGTLTLLADLEKLERLIDLETESYKEIEAKLQHQADMVQHSPSIRPVEGGRLTSHLGWRKDPFGTGRPEFHKGLDFGVERGSKVFATADGTVIFASRYANYGNLVELDHNRKRYGFSTKYAHLQKILVKVGQTVRRGDIIGEVGSTGRALARHLHYEVLRDNDHVDPLKYYVEPSLLQ